MLLFQDMVMPHISDIKEKIESMIQEQQKIESKIEMLITAFPT